MSQYKINRIVVCLALTMIATISLTQTADAQRRPRSVIDRKTHPEKGFWENRRAARNIRHAQDYSRDFYRYSREVPIMAPEVAKKESEHLGKNIKAAKKELSTVAKHYKGDQDVQTALKTINKHLTEASSVHKRLEGECCKKSPDGTATMHCCSEITKALDKAAAEQGALIRMLELRKQKNDSHTEHSKEKHSKAKKSHKEHSKTEAVKTDKK